MGPKPCHRQSLGTRPSAVATHLQKETEEMALEPTKHVNGRMWPPGVSGNPNGRPVGSRTVFSQAFLKDLAEVWSEEGREAMVKTAKTNPTVFFATCARLIGPEVKLTIEQSY